MRSQIRALRLAAQASHEALSNATPADQSGHMLTAGMNAGFALELGLKLFIKTYRESGIEREHELGRLFKKLPEQIKGDIRESYAASLSASSMPASYPVIGFRTSEQQPSLPSEAPTLDTSNAEDLLSLASKAFVSGRYFFEDVGSEQWSVTGYPINHMLLMSGVLDVVYDAYIQRGGWA